MGVVSGTKEETQCERYCLLDRHSEWANLSAQWNDSSAVDSPTC